MIKKLIGMFLLIVLAIQVLPVMQVGALLCSNQLNEEIPHGFDVEKDTIKKISSKSDFLLTFFQVESVYLLAETNHYLHYSDKVPSNYSTEIHVPPPNC
jgi:hypothetical protein